jgi:HTH-type transcriptional regulator, sugar sensing transcriptional regulator
MDFRDLEYLGLSEKEAKVYLAGLSLGKSTVQKISEKAQVNRATTYVIIETLMNKGIVSSISEDKKQYFYAENPEKLSLLFREQAMAIQRKHEYLEKILPELKAVKISEREKPTVRYYEGKSGMKVIAEEIFKSNSHKDNTMRLIYSYDKLLKMFTDEEILDMREKRTVRDVKAKVIFNDDQGRFNSTKVETLRVDSNKYNIKADIAVMGNITRMITQNTEPKGLIIENKEISETLSVLFDLAWEYLRKNK